MDATKCNKNGRILIIDDNPSIHADFGKILCPSNTTHGDLFAEAADLFKLPLSPRVNQTFELDSAYQGEEGLRMIEAAQAEGRPYALAFVDVRMPPGWDGVETISKIWAVCPDTQIVICTAYSDHSWEEIITQVGKAESLLILKKPFDNVEVLQLAHALTEKWILNHELKGRLSNLETLIEARTQDLEQANAFLRNEAAAREATQTALLRSEERFSKAFHATPAPIALHGVADGRFVDANDSFLAMSGYTRSELLELPAEVLRLTFDAPQSDLPQPARGLAGSIHAKSGAARDVLISTELISLAEQPCVLTLLVDVTEQRMLERKLRQAQKLEGLGQLAAGIAHNFNNILGVILGHASLHLQPSGARGVERSLQEIANAAERGARLVRQLLAAGQQQRNVERPLDLNAMVLGTKHLLAPLLGQNIELICDRASELPFVLADPSNLEQILMNLVINARDAMPKEGGRITIQTRQVEIDEMRAAAHPQARTGNFVQLCVIDNGSGMDASTVERIFEPFFTTKGVGSGTGLGLATVHGIVAQHGGWIEVTSAPGHGSTFQVYLPVCHEPVPALAATPIQSGAAPKGETVLLVDDEAGVRNVLRLTLERSGYRVLVADDASKALSIWSKQESEVDLLLTDLSMPGGLSGFELAERLRAKRPKLPVIFSSGYAPDKSATLRQYQGATFLQKPYTAEFVLEAVRASLNAA